MGLNCVGTRRADWVYTRASEDLALKRIEIKRLGRLTILDLAFFAFALASLSYAAVTAPSRGVDLVLFHQGAQNWVDGTYQTGIWPIALYPPFAFPILAPLALFSFDLLVIMCLAANVAAIVVVLRFTLELFGADWPPKERLYLAALFLSWAPLRVTLRNGQITLFITALLLGALVARRNKKQIIAGLLLGLTLIKYPLTFPFLLYVVWKREWKLVAASLLIPAALTPVFAFRLGLAPIEAARRYVDVITGLHVNVSGWTGTTEIKLLLVGVTGGDGPLAGLLSLALAGLALVAMAFLFARRTTDENQHYSLLALFALWSSYHRTYDALICILPAALLIGFLIKNRFVGFSRFWLGGLGLFVVSVPGLLLDRLKLDPATVSGNPLGWLGLHIERIVVFGMFWSLMALALKEAPSKKQARRADGPASPGDSLKELPDPR